MQIMKYYISYTQAWKQKSYVSIKIVTYISTQNFYFKKFT